MGIFLRAHLLRKRGHGFIRCALLLACSHWAGAQNYIISTIAGGGFPPLPMPATGASLDAPTAVTVDGSGNVLFIVANAVFKVDTTGKLTRVAGKGTITGYSGNGGAATSALLANPRGIAVDSNGILYIADTYNNVIRKVAPDGGIVTVAGNGSFGEAGNGGPATSAQLSHPQAVAVDGSGNLYIADAAMIRKVTPGGTITTVAGNGISGYAGDGGPAISAQIGPCYGLAADSGGNLYLSDYSNNVIRKVTSTGTITTVAGNGQAGYTGDGSLATSAQLRNPGGIAVDTAGSLYIADSANGRIRKVATGGTITTVAGNGTFPASGSGFVGAAGDGGPAINAQLGFPTGIAVDSAGNLYIADQGSHRVRKVTAGVATITSAAGNGFTGYSGDGGPATNAQLGVPLGIVVDSAGNLYVSDADNNVVRKITPGGVITTVAGNGGGTPGYTGDGGPATNATLSGPAGLAIDASGNLFIADMNNSVVRKVSAGGTITTVAGKSSCGYSGDGGLATNALLCNPWGLALDTAGNLYIADSGNNLVRKVAAGGTITTVAGTRTAGYSGDGGLATLAQLSSPTGVAVSAGGTVYIADYLNNRIRAVTPTGMITTVAGGGTVVPGDGGPATAAQLAYPAGVWVDAAGNLYIAETNSGLIRQVGGTGTITTIAGNTTFATALYSGDGGPASGAAVGSPQAVTMDAGGNVYLADVQHDVIRMLTPAGSHAVLGINVTHGTFSSGQLGAVYNVVVNNATNAAAANGTVTVSESIPAGLTLTSLSGTGWSCAGNTCTRNDPLNPGASYPPITALVSVAPNAPGEVVNLVSVSGGGAPPASASDVTLIFPPCSYTINPGSATAPGAGGNGSVTLTAAIGCPWSVASNAPWLTIVSGGGGWGNGTVTYSIAPNAQPLQQTGTLTVGGQTFTVTQAPPVATNTEAFVRQLYLDILSRTADSGGLNTWVNWINTGVYTRAQVAASFFQSQEFYGTGNYITKLYLAIMLRDPDYAGWTGWFNYLHNGWSQTDVLNQFLASPEFQSRYGALDNTAFVTLLYNNILNRAPDQAGLNQWVAWLNNRTYTRAQVANSFVLSQEFDLRERNRIYSNMLYIGFLRRAGELSGLDGWTNWLTNGTYTLQQAVNGFITSAEYLARF